MILIHYSKYLISDRTRPRQHTDSALTVCTVAFGTKDETNRPASHVPHTSAVVARDQIVVRDLLMVGDSVSVHSHTAVLCKWHHVDHCSIGDVLYYVHGHVWYCNRNVTAQLISDEYLNTLLGVAY